MPVEELINILERFDEYLLATYDLSYYLSYYGYKEVDIVKCELSNACQTEYVLIE